MITRFLTCGALATLLAMAGTAGAQTSTFRITQVYSNLDGSVQFVELTESAGLNGQHRLKGLDFTSTHNGVVKRFTIPQDLPSEQTANASVVFSTAAFLFAGPTCCHVPDARLLPVRFLATDGGTLEFAGSDRLTYARLPSDGISALYRDGTVSDATIPSCSGVAGCVPRYKIDHSTAYAIEYYNAVRDHYFIATAAPDIDALDNGRMTGWTRTGATFLIGTRLNAFPNSRPVCRFYLPPSVGDSHFFSASTEECEAVRERFPAFILESSAAFYVTVPDPETGLCPAPQDSGSADYTVPVYRLWNRRPDTNHRHTTSTDDRSRMIQLGYVSEGYGPTGVVMCEWKSVWDY